MERRSATDTADQLLGQLVRGYRIDERLGSSPTTALYRLQPADPSQAEPRTLLVLHPEPHLCEASRERFLTRFVQEATALVHLDHPHISPVLGYGELSASGSPYLLLPDAQVETLASLLKRQNRLSPAFAVAIVERVAEALDYAHRHGVLHRGLCPARIIYHDRVGVQLTGLGLVRLVEMRGIEEMRLSYPHLRTIAGTFYGNAAYLAPEVVAGHAPDARADIYALGILLFTLLCGHPPFEGTDYLDVARQQLGHSIPPLRALCPSVPLALELVLHHALQHDPNERFQSALDLARACVRVLKRRIFVSNALHSPEILMSASPNTRQTDQIPAVPLEASTGPLHPFTRPSDQVAQPTQSLSSGKPTDRLVAIARPGDQFILYAPRQAERSNGAGPKASASPDLGSLAEKKLPLVPERTSPGIETLRGLIAQAWAELLPSATERAQARRQRRFRAMFPVFMLLVLLSQNEWLFQLVLRARL